MSRLDSAIRRFEAQRACLNRAINLTMSVPGPIFELGLGNGRTYDHLREQASDRRIIVFECKPNPHPDCWPPEDDLIEGDFETALPQALAVARAKAALVHADMGNGDKPETQALARRLVPLLQPLLAPGAVVVSDERLDIPGGTPLPLPESVAEDRYFMLRMPN